MDNGHASPALFLTVDAQSFSQGIVDVAVELALSANVRLHGLFVEDEDLLRVAALPFAREVSSSTAEIRPITLQKVERALRTQGEQFRDYLAQIAEAARVPWTFAVKRGISREIGMRQDGDALFSIVARAIACRPSTPRLVRRRRILLMGEESENLQHVLQVLASLNRDVLVDVLWSHAGDSVYDVATPVADHQPGNELQLRIRQVSSDEALRLSRLPPEFDYIIASRQLDKTLLKRILRTSVCPVILVS